MVRRALTLAIIGLIVVPLACLDYALEGPKPPDPGEQPDALAPSTIVEEFLQRTAVASDILFLVDDSGSMGGEQTNLIDNFTYFAQYIFDSDVDFHIGVVRLGLEGNASDGRLEGIPTYIEPGTPSGQQAFALVIEGLGTDGGSVCESGLQAAYAALTEPHLSGWNDGFYREDALLSIVIVSDENDNASLGLCDWPNANPYEWVPWVLALKRDPDMVHFGVIAGFSTSDHVTPANCESPELGMADAAANYWLANSLMGGISWSICDPDWSSVLADIGLAAAGLTRQYNLSRVPIWDDDDWDGDGITDEPVLEIWLDRQDGNGFVLTEPLWSPVPDPDNPWDYDRTLNAVIYTIETMPAEGWVVKAVYPNSAES